MLDDPIIQKIDAITEPVDFSDDSHIAKRDGQRPASVLMPLVNRGHDWQVLFTKRPDYLPSHPGQISFPGGRTEAGELPHEGALREVHEEVGVESKYVHLLGRLPSFDAVSDYRVTPFVGIIDPEAPIIPCDNEVEEAFELPFSFFMNADNHIPNVRTYEGREFTIYDMPWPNANNVQYNVWGMTAMMLYRLYQRGFS